MAQRVKMFSAKPDNLSLILRTHQVEENGLWGLSSDFDMLYAVLWSTCTDKCNKAFKVIVDVIYMKDRLTNSSQTLSLSYIHSPNCLNSSAITFMSDAQCHVIATKFHKFLQNSNRAPIASLIQMEVRYSNLPQIVLSFVPFIPFVKFRLSDSYILNCHFF